MAGPGLGRDARVRYSECSLVQNFVSDEGSEVPCLRWLVGIAMLLETLVCAEAVA